MYAVDAIVDLMLGLLPPEVQGRLARDPLGTIPTEFAPAHCVALAPGTSLRSDDCSCDGFYDDQLVPGVPHLMYREDRTAPRRVRFTLLHEFGHHVIRYLEPDLLDLIDVEAGNRGSVERLEERACHEFAGRLLLPDAYLDELLGDQTAGPQHLIEMYTQRGTSWEASAVRLAGRITGPGAVIVIRTAGRVAFSASSPGLTSWWPPGSHFDPTGPLARATERPATAQPDTFRFGLGGELRLWCNIRQAWPGLGLAVLNDRPSDGRMNFLPPADDEWGRLYCLRCGELREGNWCYDCRGATCLECGACGCYRRAPERLCEGPCGLLKGLGTFAPASDLCRDCLEA